jgi:cyclopropane fatty-acyl-phospholipid synthase-like methyltransferase
MGNPLRSSLLVLLVACSSSAKPHPHDHSSGMPHRFDNAERWAKVFDDPERDRWQEPDRVIAALALTKDVTVADVGAGTGYFAVRIAPLVKEVIATDIEASMVDYMKQRAQREGLANLRAQLTPPDDPQLANVDRILVVDVWHHLGDRKAYAQKLAAALTAGGFVAVVDFKLDASMGPPKEHRLPPAAIIEDLHAAGLDASVGLELTEQYVVIGRKKQ